MYPIKKLQDCATIIAGQSPESKYYNSTGEGIPFFQGKADFGELYPKVRVYCSSPTKIAQYNDILLSVRAPVGPTNLSPGTVCIGRGLAAIRPDDSLDLKYLLYYFRYFETQLSAKGTGTTFKAINQKLIKNLEIPIPPLNEQTCIVARIEELFSELDKSVDTLKTTKEQLAVYRQAVLKDAFSNIAEYIPFGKITSSRLGKMLDKQKNVGVPCKYLRNINVRWFSFDLSDLLDMKIEEKEFEKYTICKNDLVICEGGKPGRCAVWEKDETIFYQKALHRVRFTIKAEPRFYMYYLWYITQSGSINKFYTGTGIKHLTGQSLEKIPVPVTDIGEQKRLLELIEMRLSVCDNIEKTVDAALAQADAMRQSILKQAFEGKI